jgi:hypothetical protein
MHAVILERNKLVGRRIARLFLSVGVSAVTVEEPGQVAEQLANAHLLCADTFDGDLVAEMVRARPGLRGILWTAEPLRRSIRHMVESAAMCHVFARKDFESMPRPWEFLMVARRLASPQAPPPLAAFLDWGYTAIEPEVRTTADRDVAVGKVQEFVGALQVPKRVGEMFGELTHELLMNAMYDAPVDAQGRAIFAADRKAEVTLSDAQRPTVRLATDGTRLVLQVADPFGRLERRHVFDGLARGLAGGEMDQSHGGAGLGMMVCHNSSAAMFFDVSPGRHTQVTAMFELDLNLREFRTQAKSLHFFHA